MSAKFTYTALCLGILWLAGFQPVHGQDIGGFFDDINSRITSREFFKFSGSLQANMRVNHISGIPSRVAPFSARLNAALLVDFLGIKGPFSAAFSDGNLAYNLPAYSFVGFSPTYKWIQLHAGDRSMEFSPYSLTGNNFRGIGVELRPGKFYFGAMSGRMQRARLIDAGAIQNFEPAYKRVGRGVKVGFDDGKNQLAGIAFYANDEVEQTHFSDTFNVRPQENLVLELQGKKVLGTLFDVSFDVAHSILTRDKTAPLFQQSNRGLNGRVFGLLTPHSSTAYGQAWQASIGFTPSFARFTLGIEHIGTGYQSLGRLSFLNDTENIQIGTSTSLFKKRLSLSATGGIQRNGLSSAVAVKGNRWIGSINAGIRVSDRVNTSLAFSNLNYTMRQRVSTVPFVVVDSIVIVQSNLSAQWSTSYLMGADMQSVLSCSFAYQNANAVDGDEVQVQQDNAFYTAVVNYSKSVEAKGLTLSFTGVVNLTDISIAQTRVISPSFSLQKKMLKEALLVSQGIAYSNVKISTNDKTSSIVETSTSAQWKIAEKHNLRLQFGYVINRTTSTETGLLPFTDINLMTGYIFTFK